MVRNERHSLYTGGGGDECRLPAVSQFVCCAVQNSTAQHSTAQHSTAQHSTAQHSTAALLYSSAAQLRAAELDRALVSSAQHRGRKTDRVVRGREVGT